MSDYSSYCPHCKKDITLTLGCDCHKSKKSQNKIQEQFIQEQKIYQAELSEAKRWLINQGYHPHLPSEMFDFDSDEWVKEPELKLQLWIKHHRENSIDFTEMVKFIQSKFPKKD